MLRDRVRGCHAVAGLPTGTLVCCMLAASALPAAAQQGGGERTTCSPAAELRIDHVPIAVRDLGAAGELFRRLGFTLKPGRPHDNGLANLHAKFADGTELELITARAAVDAVTAGYVEFLEAGDGAAFLALHAGALDAVEDRLRPVSPRLWRVPGMVGFPSGHRWERYFFGLLNRSPTDRPEHFEHRNGARALHAVWLADEAADALLAEFGAVPCGSRHLSPLGERADVVALAAGSAVYRVSGRQRLRPDRPIVGVTVRVGDVGAAASLLGGAGIPYTKHRDAAGRSLWLRPEVAPGLWIELLSGPADN